MYLPLTKLRVVLNLTTWTHTTLVGVVAYG